MYEQHFGLERRPFPAKATGTDVFVGPQTARTMEGFRKALATQDAVVAISGPVGTGKTTLVERAIDAMGTKYKTVRVGRMAMDSSDVLEALLVVLGVQDRPAGTIQRFAALRKKLQELQDRDVRVFIVIEDALRAGVETLAELEALTAADAGESDGASIVLMGDERLAEFMQSPQLGQLQQRVRQRHTIYPQCGAEMRAYLMHCFRQVGGDFEGIFDARSVALLKELSGGIPRIANNLVESSLAVAAEKGLDRIPATLIAAVASDEYGLSANNFDFTSPLPEDSVARDSAEAGAESITDSPPAQETETAAADAEEEAIEGVDDVPHLIHDTLPNLEILSPHYAELAMGDVEDSREADDVSEPESEAVAELSMEPEATQDTAEEIVPQFIREPVQLAVEDIDSMTAPEMEVAGEMAADYTSVPDPSQAETSIPEPVAAFAPEPLVDDIPELVPEPSPEQLAEIIPDLLPESEPQAIADNSPELMPEPQPAAELIPELIPEPEPEPAAEVIPELVPEPESEAVAELIPELVPEPESEAVAELIPEPEPDPLADNIPELAHASDLATEVVPELRPQSDLASYSTPDLEAELTGENTDISDQPEPDREPTLAELKPDLEALEQAMAFAHGGATKKSENAPAASGSLGDHATLCDEIPEITLDKTIETGIENIQAEDADNDRPLTPLKKSAVELDKIAAEIGMAATLEDFDDKMAETLFGTGISMIAAQLTLNPPTSHSANDEIELAPEEPTPASLPPVTESPDASPEADLSEEITLSARTAIDAGAMLPTATQRLKTVRSLNAKPVPPARKPDPAAAVGSTAPVPPAPIEDQIKTSITQTLKALELPANLEDDEPEEETKRGFFSRFRRS